MIQRLINCVLVLCCMVLFAIVTNSNQVEVFASNPCIDEDSDDGSSDDSHDGPSEGSSEGDSDGSSDGSSDEYIGCGDSGVDPNSVLFEESVSKH